jgi:hypothetical protein
LFSCLEVSSAIHGKGAATPAQHKASSKARKRRGKTQPSRRDVTSCSRERKSPVTLQENNSSLPQAVARSQAERTNWQYMHHRSLRLRTDASRLRVLSIPSTP